MTLEEKSRPLAELAPGNKVPETYGTEEKNVHKALDETPPGATTQSLSAVELCKKSEARQAALCAAFGTAATALVVEFFRIPNSYMALSFAYTLTLLPRAPFGHIVMRLVALTLGIIASMLLLITFPEAPWFYIPLVGVIPSALYSFFFKHSGPGSGYAFGAYFLAFHVMMTSTHFSKDFIVQGLKLWSQAAIPIIVVCGVALMTKEKKPASVYHSFDLSSLVSMGLTLTIAVLFENMIESDEAARFVMASISCIATLETEKSTYNFLYRSVGYCCGAALATAFIVGMVALGNDVGFYLLALGSLFGLLEWIACHYENQAIFYRAISSMLSFSILMLPAPDQFFHIPYERIVNSLLGFFIAIVTFLIVRECTKFTHYFLRKEPLLEAA